jgi:hypothetical protein
MSSLWRPYCFEARALPMRPQRSGISGATLAKPFRPVKTAVVADSAFN